MVPFPVARSLALSSALLLLSSFFYCFFSAVFAGNDASRRPTPTRLRERASVPGRALHVEALAVPTLRSGPAVLLLLVLVLLASLPQLAGVVA